MWRVERALRILELLVSEPEGARVTDLAAALGVNRAIPYRVLAELCELGYVVQDPTTDRYRATFKLGSLGLRQLETAGISRWARDELETLASSTKELVRLGVVSGDSLVLVARAQGADWGLLLDTQPRSGAASYVSANGRAWLSTLPETEVLEHLASSTQGPPPALMMHVVESIAEARRVGYALIEEELEVGVNAMAVPIIPRDSPGARAVGTLSIAGPSARMTPEVLLGFVPQLRGAAERLARQWHVYAYMVALARPAAPGADGVEHETVLPAAGRRGSPRSSAGSRPAAR
jgi:IclR family acetate operon transcriptional repressor